MGRSTFRDYAARTRALYAEGMPDMGVLGAFDDLACDWFDPAQVDPLIREFYEHTTRFQIKASIRWNPQVRGAGRLYEQLVSKIVRQLDVPHDDADDLVMNSTLGIIDLNRDGRPDHHIWLRTFEPDGHVFYVAAVDAYKTLINGRKAAYIRLVFPLPRANMTVILRPDNRPCGGFAMTSFAGPDHEAGSYLLFPHQRSFSLCPAFGLGEEFLLERSRAVPDAIDVVHREYWLRRRAFEITYRITRKPEVHEPVSVPPRESDRAELR